MRKTTSWVAVLAVAAAPLGAQLVLDGEPVYLVRRDLDRDGVPDRLGTTVVFDAEALHAPGRFFPVDQAFFAAGIGGGIEVTPPAMGPAIDPGDVLTVTGTVGQLDGRTRVAASSIVVRATDRFPSEPRTLTLADLLADPEAFEGTLVRVEGLSFVGPVGWPSAGMDATLPVADATASLELFVDADTNIDGTPAPVEPFAVVAVFAQDAPAPPFDAGYQLWPRRRFDIAGATVPLAIVAGPRDDDVGYCSTTIQWRTNLASDSLVEFGTAGGPLDRSVFDATSTREHELVLTPLDPDTTYDYQVTSCIGQQCTTSGVESFTTLDASGGTPTITVVEGPRLLDVTATRFTVEYATSAATDTILRYGLTPLLGTEVRSGPPRRRHRVTVTRLHPGGRIFFRIVTENPPTDACPVVDGEDCDGVIDTTSTSVTVGEGGGGGEPDAASGEEWVELVNRAGTAIDLAGVTITDQDGHWFRFPASLVLPRGGFVVLDSGLGTDDLDPSDGLVVVYLGDDPNWAFDVWDDDGDEVVVADAAGAALDYAEYGAPAAGVDPLPEGFDWSAVGGTKPEAPLVGESLQRCDGGYDTDQGSDFQIGTTPTYGAPNGPVPVAVGASLTGARDAAGLLLTWTPTGASGYRIYRSAAADFAVAVPLVEIAAEACAAACTFVDAEGLNAGAGSMFYRVLAYEPCGGQAF